MKNKTIMTSFLVFLIFSVISRFVQITYTIDYTTGFFKKDLWYLGAALLAVTLIGCLITAIFSFKSFSDPEDIPKQNIFLEISSIAFAVALGYELFTEKSGNTVLPIISLILKVFGVATICYLVVFALSSTQMMRKIRLFSVVTVCYFLVRLMASFISVSSFSMISDNVLLLASYAAILLFVLNFSKLYNGIDKENNSRKVLATGFSSVLLSFTQAIPNIVFSIVKPNVYPQIKLVTSVSLLFCGIFILTFVLSYFHRKEK